jgi:hypothetical protein
VIQISRVEIRYFRSIHKAVVRDLSDIVIIAGRNDAGKSNVLKALNLFFNNQSDWLTQLDFNRDFSRHRLREVRTSIKAKQFIEVNVHFERGARYEKTLPPKFSVTRTWYRESATPVTRSSLEGQFKRGELPTSQLSRAQASLQRYLNSIRYEYVPAIKDHSFFSYMLGRLQDIILDKKSSESHVVDAIEKLNKTIKGEVTDLRKEFELVTGVSAVVQLPQELAELFRAFSVGTLLGDESMPLNQRGDGIRTRFIPSLMNYVTRHTNLSYIWGFEEPENSLEHGLATKLAREIQESYSKHAQIILTSHSPAFFSLKDDNVTVLRVHPSDVGDSNVIQIRRGKQVEETALTQLETELGLMEFQARVQKEYEERVLALEAQKAEVDALKKSIDEDQGPQLLTEGKWDSVILQTAWKKLNPGKRSPFKIRSCDPMDSDPAHTSGGVSTLKALLETWHPNDPVVVGLFDRDSEGRKKGFDAMNGTFEKYSKDEDIKCQKLGSAAAMLLPVTAGREGHAKADNLVMEYYFADGHLLTKVEGRGIELECAQIERVVRTSNFRLTPEQSDDPCHKRVVDSSKKWFAEKVVPSLPAEAFSPFAALFEKVDVAIKHLDSVRAKRSKKLAPKEISALS